MIANAWTHTYGHAMRSNNTHKMQGMLLKVQ